MRRAPTSSAAPAATTRHGPRMAGRPDLPATRPSAHSSSGVYRLWAKSETSLVSTLGNGGPCRYHICMRFHDVAAAVLGLGAAAGASLAGAGGGVHACATSRDYLRLRECRRFHRLL